MRFQWLDAQVDAYFIQAVMRSRYPGFSEEQVRPSSAICVLSFSPQTSMPRLEGTEKELYGKSDENPDVTGIAPFRYTLGHEFTYDYPVISTAFKEIPAVKDGKVLFKFGRIENVTGVSMAQHSAIDWGGMTHKECEEKLYADFPEIGNKIKQAKLVAPIKSIESVTIIPLQTKN